MEAEDYLKSRGLKSVDYVGSSTNLKEVDLIELIENYADHKTEHLHQRVKELEEALSKANAIGTCSGCDWIYIDYKIRVCVKCNKREQLD